MIFDKKGNLLYTKVDRKSNPANAFLMKSSIGQNTAEQLQSQIGKKTFNPQDIVNCIVKSASEQAYMNQRQRVIQEVKQRSIATLNEMFQKKNYQSIVKIAQEAITRTAQEMTNEVDKLLRENEVLRNENQRQLNLIVDLQNETEKQNLKNQMVQQNTSGLINQLDNLKKSSQQIEKFMPQYRILTQKFPELLDGGANSAQTVIKTYEQLEKLCLQLSEKVSELEQLLNTGEQDKQNLIMQNDSKIKNIEEKDYERERHYRIKMDQLCQKQDEIKQQRQYETKYLELFNAITKLFANWQSQNKAYTLSNAEDNGPVIDVKDPIKMLEMIEQMMKITTPEKMQDYLRKIIVSANLLQRKYLKYNVNDQFNPDIIYEKILNLVNKLNSDNFKLRVENRELRRKTGIGMNNQVYINKDSKNFKKSELKQQSNQQIVENNNNQENHDYYLNENNGLHIQKY